MLCILTWWASHSCWTPAASVSLGANGPRKPPGTNSIWGRNLMSSGLAPARTLAPQPAPTVSREQWGPRVFSGSRQPWSWGLRGGRQGSPSSRVPAPSATSGGGGKVCWASQDSSEVWEDPGPQGGQAGSQLQSGDWYLIPPTHPHKGVCSPLTNSPRRPPSPGLPWAAGEPQTGAGSSGAAGVGGTARWVTVSTATCGGRRREMGGSQGLTRDCAYQWTPVLGAGGPGSQQSPAWPRTSSKVTVVFKLQKSSHLL